MNRKNIERKDNTMDHDRYIKSLENNKKFLEEGTDQLPIIQSDIESLVKALQEDILKYNPLKLLSQLEIMAICSKSGITSECQQLNEEEYACQRAVEYVQSVYVSCERDPEMEVEDTDQAILTRIVSNIEKMYLLTSQYIMLYGIKYKEEHEEDRALIDEIVEAQLMYGVRGKRYQVFEKEYYTKLLYIHDTVFQECFQMSSNDIVNGIEKLQYALTQGKLDGMNKIAEILNENEDDDEETTDFYEVLRSHKEELQEYATQFMENQLNNVCLITGWKESFVKQLSFCIGEDTSFFSAEEYPGWPIIDLPVQKRPFIEINGQYYCFDYFSFIDNFYRAIQKMISRVKNEYQWSKNQQIASEKAVADIFGNLLPGCTIYSNNFYPVGTSLKQMCENDILVQYNDILCIIEVKAGSFVYTAPITDFKQHIESYKKLIQEPNNQCKRTLDYINSGEQVQLYNEDKTEKVTIDTSIIRDIYTFSVTIDNINTLAAKAEKSSFLQSSINGICIAIDDLMIYQDYFESPLIFLHYIKQRREATKNRRIDLCDELDHLGMYIEDNCYALENDVEQYSRVYYVGYRERLDTYYGELYHKDLSPNKPQQKLISLYNEIIKFLESSNIHNKIQIANYLLDLSSDAREQFSDSVNRLYDNQKATGRRNIVATVGHETNGTSYTCFIQQPHIKDTSWDDQVEYTLSIMNWFGETKRILICISFSEKKRITNIDFEELTEELITEQNKEKIYEIGKQRALEKIRKYQMIHGNKIPRNDLCPCGSGKKYKMCCKNRL